MNPGYHTITAADALLALESSRSGLSVEEAAKRLREHGGNELEQKPPRSPMAIFLAQFRSSMAALLFAAAVLSAVLGDVGDMIAILAILLLNGILGYVQEGRAEAAIEELKRMASPMARVIRAGGAIDIDSRGVVPGDILVIEAGQIVPADARLIETASLGVQEAALTGESETVEKDANRELAAETTLAERVNMIHAGTTAVRGRGLAVVSETGMRTEVGRIASLLEQTEQEETPLQERLDLLGRQLAVAAILMVCVLIGIGLWNGEPWRQLLLTAISVAVAAVPEGLPVAVTIALALGASRMLERKALIRRLAAVETLGSVDVICSDKTGTLTENRMTAVTMTVGAQERKLPLSRLDPESALVLACGALCNDAAPGPEGWTGDPTEIALAEAARSNGFDIAGLREALPRVGEIPFASETRWMLTVHERRDWPAPLPALPGTGPVAFVKGAPDAILRRCEMTPAEREEMENTADRMARQGCRVLALACRHREQEPPAEGDGPLQLTFLGFIGLVDPPRSTVADAVRTCQSAGIRIVMITGDHPRTAARVAEDIGIDASRVTTGADLDSMDERALEQAASESSVHARVAPEQKLRLVHALRERGHIVSMTGDGVNDAPALKKADIGVAMGVGGTDVARQASDMVLLDNSFATIVAAVHEGRVIYANLRKFVLFLLACNSGELWVMLLGPILGTPLPLLPLQILWMNLVTDGLPALALGMDPPEPGVMSRPPRKASSGILSDGLGLMALGGGIAIGSVSLAAGFLWWADHSPAWRTLVFTTLTFSQLAVALGIRSEHLPLHRIGLGGNRSLGLAVVVTVLLQVMIVHVPPFQHLFETVDLSLYEWLVACGGAVLTLAGLEVVKAFRRFAAPPDSSK